MNISQQKYARNRIQEILQIKLKALKATHTKKVKKIPDSAKLTAVREGWANLKRNATLQTRIIDAYIFVDMEDAGEELDQKAYDKADAYVRAEAARILDELMLGDGDKALLLVRKFCGK